MPLSRADLVLAVVVVVSLGVGCKRGERPPVAPAPAEAEPEPDAGGSALRDQSPAAEAGHAALIAPDTGREVPLGVALGDPAPMPRHIAWVVAGGGVTPADNQVSIEGDVALVRERLGDDGVVLFAGGPGAHGVQVASAPRGDALRALLGDLFDPRGGRRAVYRPTILPAVQGPATAEHLLAALGAALEQGGDPLFVYLAGHGEGAERPADVLYSTWGGRGIGPAELADTLDRAGAQGRVVRLVMSSCYSGAFADIVFEGADAEAGKPAEHLHCGLFASTWDRPSSGCDPDPDRRRHEGFGIHFLNALAGLDRDGAPLAHKDIDFDGDGRVSLLEAHARARIASRGFDVPTTTSERWLRFAAPAEGPAEAVAMPEEEAVARAIEGQLGLEAGAPIAEAIATRRSEGAHLDTTVQAASEAEADAVDRVAAVLLARWPVLNDPWHPDFGATLDGERHELETFFRTSELFHAYLAARDEADAAAQRKDALSLELAPYLRLQRARDNLALAGRLAAQGGDGWARFERLRTCERGSAP